jgi:hypothetical protein
MISNSLLSPSLSLLFPPIGRPELIRAVRSKRQVEPMLAPFQFPNTPLRHVWRHMTIVLIFTITWILVQVRKGVLIHAEKCIL